MIWTILSIIAFRILSTDCLNNEFFEMGSYTKFAQNLTEVLNSALLSISVQCSDHLSKYAAGLLSEELWALEMFDSNSKLPSGLLKGRLADLGAFDECIGVSKKLNTSETLLGKYCIATIPMNLKAIRETNDLVKVIKDIRVPIADGKKGIQLATCMPNSCSAGDIQYIFRSIGLYMNFYEELCQTSYTQPKLDKSALIAVIFFAAVLIVMIISTVYDIFLYYLHKKTPNKLLTAFSVLTNGKHLLAVSKSSNQIGCLHGIRVISTMWIIIRHRYSIQPSFPMNDYFYKTRWLNTEANMYMINAAMAVDTFFLIGGLLVSYNYLTGIKKGTKFNIFLYYVHRYVRLTPVIIALIVFYIALLRHVGSGPLWQRYIENDLVIGCETYWWKALLYIQNYGNQSSMCIPHSWYLCVDMQLFLLSPIILYPLKKWPKATVAFTAFLAVCSAVAGFLVSWIYELNIMQSANTTSEKVWQYIHHYYFSTPVRAAPWLIGLVLGYFIFQFKEKDDKVVYNKFVVVILWMASVTIVCACALAGHDLTMEYEKTGSSIYMALQKSSWAIGISWMIYACVCGYGGPINWFLSLPFFEILSKLTYTLYLVHYALIYIMVGQMRETTTFGDLQAMHAFWGDFTFTLAASAVLMVSFELPMITIERVLLRRWEREYLTLSRVDVGEIAALLFQSKVQRQQTA